MFVGYRLAVQGLGQPQCGQAFSNGTFTVEEIGMGQAPMGDGCPESGNRMVVTDDVAERHLCLRLSEETIPCESLEHKSLCDQGDVIWSLPGINHCDSTGSLAREGEKPLPNFPMK